MIIVLVVIKTKILRLMILAIDTRKKIKMVVNSLTKRNIKQTLTKRDNNNGDDDDEAHDGEEYGRYIL